MAQPRPLPRSEASEPRTRGRLLRLPPRGWRLRAPGRRGRIALAAVGVLLAVIVIGSFLVDEPLRRLIERQMNERMDGYTVRIERLSFHPIGLSLTLYGLTFAQNAHPDPPVLDIPQLDASVEWKESVHPPPSASRRFDASTLPDFVPLAPRIGGVHRLRELVHDPRERAGRLVTAPGLGIRAAESHQQPIDGELVWTARA